MEARRQHSMASDLAHGILINRTLLYG